MRFLAAYFLVVEETTILEDFLELEAIGVAVVLVGLELVVLTEDDALLVELEVVLEELVFAGRLDVLGKVVRDELLLATTAAACTAAGLLFVPCALACAAEKTLRRQLPPHIVLLSLSQA